MNIKRVVAYGVYYSGWCAIFYGMVMLTIVYSKEYNVNIVCLLISLVFACIVEPILRRVKNKIDENYN